MFSPMPWSIIPLDPYNLEEYDIVDDDGWLVATTNSLELADLVVDAAHAYQLSTPFAPCSPIPLHDDEADFNPPPNDPDFRTRTLLDHEGREVIFINSTGISAGPNARAVQLGSML